MRTRTLATAREAARLLYLGLFEEYKDAKAQAAESLGTKTLPSNYDVAQELDRLAEEQEGEDRRRLLKRLRGKAQVLMRHLSSYQPRLIGSVWRGTARRGSDIDVQVYASNAEDVLDRLEGYFHVTRAEWTSKTSDGKTTVFYHIFVLFSGGDEAEISVRNPEDVSERRVDAIYGDEITGLRVEELEAVLRDDPLRRFLPEKRKVRRRYK
jgi:predicted nucleotidyltransferase